MAFNIFATATSDIPLANLDANFTMIGSSAVASTLYPTASTSITYGTAGTSHIFSGSIGAFTLGGTVAGGGNQLNNVVIGATTPLAGNFTTVIATGAISGHAASRAVLDYASSAARIWGYGVDDSTIGTVSIQVRSSAGSLGGTSATFTSTGLNSTAIGATTPSTGAFTTVTATGGVDKLTSATGVVSVAAATAPSVGQVLTATSGTVATWQTPAVTAPAGSNTQVQFNNSGAFGASANFTWDGSTLALTGAVSATTTGKVGTTLGVGAATPSASGAGITFPATQSASTDANTLDDYEEGTWTPTVTAVTTTGSPAYAGSYVKIGKQVTATMYTTGNNSPTATYTVAVNSSRFTLPFTTANLNNNFQPWTGTSGNGSTTAGGLVAADGATCYFITAITVTNNICATITYSI